MRFYKICVLLCLIISPLRVEGDPSDKGYILLIEDERAYIDLGADSGISSGVICAVYETSNASQIEIGRIQIVEVFENGAAATIIDRQPGNQIQVANRIVPLPSTGDLASASPSLVGSETFKPPNHARSKTTVWLALASGVALGIGAIYSHQRADNAYELYQLAQTRAGTDFFQDRTERLDRNSRIFLGTTVVALATATILFFRRNEPPKAISTTMNDGQPYISMVRVDW